MNTPREYSSSVTERYAAKATNGVQRLRPAPFEDHYRQAWRSILDARSAMPHYLVKFSHDQTRDDMRYPPRWLHNAITASLHTPSIGIALSWVEAARAEILAHHPAMRVLCWHSSVKHEAVANARGDVALDRLLWAKYHGTPLEYAEACDEFIEAMLEQKIASRLSVDATHLIKWGRVS